MSQKAQEELSKEVILIDKNNNSNNKNHEDNDNDNDNNNGINDDDNNNNDNNEIKWYELVTFSTNDHVKPENTTTRKYNP